MLLLLVAGIALGSFGLGFLAVKKGLAGKPGLQPKLARTNLGGLSGLAVLIVYRLLRTTVKIFSSPKRRPTAHSGQRSPCSWYPALQYRFGSVDMLEVFFSIWVNPESASF